MQLLAEDDCVRALRTNELKLLWRKRRRDITEFFGAVLVEQLLRLCVLCMVFKERQFVVGLVCWWWWRVVGDGEWLDVLKLG